MIDGHRNVGNRPGKRQGERTPLADYPVYLCLQDNRSIGREMQLRRPADGYTALHAGKGRGLVDAQDPGTGQGTPGAFQGRIGHQPIRSRGHVPGQGKFPASAASQQRYFLLYGHSVGRCKFYISHGALFRQPAVFVHAEKGTPYPVPGQIGRPVRGYVHPFRCAQGHTTQQHQGHQQQSLSHGVSHQTPVFSKALRQIHNPHIGVPPSPSPSRVLLRRPACKSGPGANCAHNNTRTSRHTEGW